MLIECSSACKRLLFNHFFGPFLEISKGGVLVKVERLHPLETSAANNMISCFGNDNRAGNSSPVLCSSTFSRCRATLTLKFNYILIECPIYVSLKSHISFVFIYISASFSGL